MNKKMSEADEMFYILGYKKDTHSLVVCGKKTPYIKYTNEITGNIIAFNINKRVVSISVSGDYNEVLQAINEKCKELGWLE